MVNPRQERARISRMRHRCTHSLLALAAMFVSAIAADESVQAQTYSVLYAFKGAPDGQGPFAGVARDKAGNIYGTTYWAGNSHNCGGGCGIVFKLRPNGKEVVLHSFSGYQEDDGEGPQASVMLDTAGNIYGTTCQGGVGLDVGIVFKLDRQGKETILHSFGEPPDGNCPSSRLLLDKTGIFYGTTALGGTDNLLGTIFKIDHGKETVLHSFRGFDGIWPFANLTRDQAGDLYGATAGGGTKCSGDGCGTVFKLDKAGKLTVLYNFTGGADGSYPHAGLVLDDAGNLFGNTEDGGTYNFGTVFRLNRRGRLTVLHTFTGGADGAQPTGQMARDTAGNLYGTAEFGGLPTCYEGRGCGTLFKVSSRGDFTILHSFAGGTDGGGPFGDLLMDNAGSLYGTTVEGGDVTCVSTQFGQGCGTVFKLIPALNRGNDKSK
jgi:uncharacterized repeat protein (TIGR03803 family)